MTDDPSIIQTIISHYRLFDDPPPRMIGKCWYCGKFEIDTPAGNCASRRRDSTK